MCPVLFGVAEVFLCTTDSGKRVFLKGHATPTLPRHINAEFRPCWIGLMEGADKYVTTFFSADSRELCTETKRKIKPNLTNQTCNHAIA